MHAGIFHKEDCLTEDGYFMLPPRCPSERRREVPPVIQAGSTMKARPDALESAKSCFFDTSNWGPFCDVTLTLKQARQSERGAWVKIDDYPCRQAFTIS